MYYERVSAGSEWERREKLSSSKLIIFPVCCQTNVPDVSISYQDLPAQVVCVHKYTSTSNPVEGRVSGHLLYCFLFRIFLFICSFTVALGR